MDTKSLQDLYEEGHYEECLNGLSEAKPCKAVEHNKIITRFHLDSNIENLLQTIQCTEDLQLDQQVLYDYNRALALSKHKGRFEEAIDILENRMLVLTEPFGVVDEKIAFKLFYLLAVIYIERKRNLQKALNLLQIINDKCDPACSPPNLQYMKVKCYLAMCNFKKAKKKLRFLNTEESNLVRVYIEYFKSLSVKACKLFREIIPQPETLTADYLNNEAAFRFNDDPSVALLQITTSGLLLPPEIRYNVAYWHLFSGNVPAALQCYKSISRSFSNNPKLWLHLAECYVQTWLHACRLQQAKNRNTQILKGQLGDHSNRKVLLNSGRPVQSYRYGGVSNTDLVMARGCLLNALMLLAQDESQLSFYPSNYLTENELKQFRISLHLQLIYVNLRLQDYILAQRYAIELLLNHQPNGLQRILATSYLAEIQVHLNGSKMSTRMNETINQLQEASKLLASETKLIQQDSEFLANTKYLLDWDLNRLLYTLQYNTVVAMTFQGRFQEALKVLQNLRAAISTREPPSQYALLEIYLLQKIGQKIDFDSVIVGT